MKQFFAKKEKGFWFSLLAVVLFAAGLVFYRMLTSVSFETTERPVLVILFAFGAILMSLIAAYKDWSKVPSILAYAAATVAFFTLLEGRTSYLAFYFSGDVMNTGLSPCMTGSFVCFLLGMLAALFAVIFEEDKDRASFAVSDLKVVIPVFCAVAILALVVGLNAGIKDEAAAVQAGAPAAVSEGQSFPGEVTAETEKQAKYKTPNTSEEIWQDASAKDYAQEDFESKPIAYQFIASGEVDAGGLVQYDGLINLYENGLVVVSTYGRGNAMRYYGYWTNVDDENLWFCVMYYTALGMGGQYCMIDYGYELFDHFDDFTLNVALGLADGGQFVRTIPAGGDGSVQYASVKEWYASKGYDMPATELPAEKKEPAQQDKPADTANTLLFGFTADVDSFKLDLFSDGTYEFCFTSMNLSETGTWEWKDWELTLTTPNGQSFSCKPDADTHALNLTFAPDISEKLVRDYTADASVWGSAFNGEGTYTPAAGSADASEAALLFSFTADVPSFLLDLYTDGTYQFQFTSMNIEETGTWTWKDWMLTLTTPGGKAATGEIDGDTHELKITFIPDISDQLVRDYVADAQIWGTAFNGQGEYTPAEAAHAAAAEPTVLFQPLADAESFVLEILSDGTYHFAFTSMNIEESGTWTWKDWTLTLTTPNGKTATSEIDGETHDLKITFAPDISDQLVRDYVADAQTWGTAFNGHGEYTPAA